MIKKALKYFLLFIACFGLVQPLKAQLFADYSNREYKKVFNLVDSVEIKYRGELDPKDSVMLFNPRMEGNNSVYYKGFYAKKVRFEAPANFTLSMFFGEADFTGSEFFRAADFSFITFKYVTTFEGVAFFDKTNFDGAEFSNQVSFFNAYVTDTVTFKGAKLPNRTLFLGVNVRTNSNALIDFRGIKTGDAPCEIDLRFSDIDHMIFDYTKFKLYFDARYSAAKIHDTVAIKQTYEAVIAQQKKCGFEEGYQKAQKEYKAWLQNMREQKKAGTWRGALGNKTPRNSSAIWWQVFSLVFVIILVIILASHNKTSPLIAPTNAQGAIKPVAVAPKKIEQNIEKGSQLWQSYVLDPANKNEGFWAQYERLIGKAKRQR